MFCLGSQPQLYRSQRLLSQFWEHLPRLEMWGYCFIGNTKHPMAAAFILFPAARITHCGSPRSLLCGGAAINAGAPVGSFQLCAQLPMPLGKPYAQLNTCQLHTEAGRTGCGSGGNWCAAAGKGPQWCAVSGPGSWENRWGWLTSAAMGAFSPSLTKTHSRMGP